MSSSEFSIIEEYFTLHSDLGRPPVMGIGDDCAVLEVPSGKQLAVSTDTLVEGVHFLPKSDAALLGHKALAVNLSDLASMGATPAWVSLAITMPRVDKAWLSSFSQGFFDLAKQYALHLIGGDTTRGPLSITVNIMGLLPKHHRLTRSGAQVGDHICVSGNIGSAGLGLIKAKEGLSNIDDNDLQAFLRPTPRINLGKALLEMATSCIDISDGLSADLNHVLKASGVGAKVWNEKLPLAPSVHQHIEQIGDVFWPYSTGDDYELCFTLPKKMEVASLSHLTPFNITKIGVIEKEKGLRVATAHGEVKTLNKGYDHFNVE